MTALLSMTMRYLSLYLCFTIISQFFLNPGLHKSVDKGFLSLEPLVNTHLLIPPLTSSTRPSRGRELVKIAHLITILQDPKVYCQRESLRGAWRALVPQGGSDGRELSRIPLS